MAGAGDLHDLALEFLQACVDALDTVPTYEPGLGGSPARAFVSPGTPALDCCDQLTVHTRPITERSNTVHASGRVNQVALLATIGRCVPKGTVKGTYTPPTGEAQQAAAEQINADAWALWNHLYTLIAEGELFEKCLPVTWVGLSPLQPSGGCAGSVLTLNVSVDGYTDDASS